MKNMSILSLFLTFYTNSYAQFYPMDAYEVTSTTFSCVTPKGKKFNAHLSELSNNTAKLSVNKNVYSLQAMGGCMAMGCPSSYISHDKKTVITLYPEGYSDRNGRQVVLNLNNVESACEDMKQ
jgi:hypothetical protein